MRRARGEGGGGGVSRVSLTPGLTTRPPLPQDVNNCGTCGNVGSPCCSGVVSDLTTDPNNCGACGNVVPDGATCCGGQSLGPTLDAAYYLGPWQCCDNVIVAVPYAYATDSDNCGSCGNSISPSQRADSCCINGEIVAGVDFQTDVNNCGSCGFDIAAVGTCCNNGVAQNFQFLSYPTSNIQCCNGFPIDLAYDPYNCGACGAAVPVREYSFLGNAFACCGGQAYDQTLLGCCNGVLTDTSTDPHNCGDVPIINDNFVSYYSNAYVGGNVVFSPACGNDVTLLNAGCVGGAAVCYNTQYSYTHGYIDTGNGVPGLSNAIYTLSAAIAACNGNPLCGGFSMESDTYLLGSPPGTGQDVTLNPPIMGLPDDDSFSPSLSSAAAYTAVMTYFALAPPFTILDSAGWSTYVGSKVTVYPFGATLGTPPPNGEESGGTGDLSSDIHNCGACGVEVPQYGFCCNGVPTPYSTANCGECGEVASPHCCLDLKIAAQGYLHVACYKISKTHKIDGITRGSDDDYTFCPAYNDCKGISDYNFDDELITGG